MRDRGTLYPASGRVGNGHHNLAWGLNADSRFDQNPRYLEEFVEEIQSKKPRSVVISSEDFEYLYRRPKRLVELRRHVVRCGLEPTVVICLRSQVDYVESLYFELSRHGMSVTIDDFVETVLADGGVTHMSGKWDFRIDYEPLVMGFSAVFGERGVQVIPYEDNMVEALFRRYERILGEPGLAIALRLNGRGVGLGGPDLDSKGPNPDRATISAAHREALEHRYRGQIERLTGRFPATC